MFHTLKYARMLEEVGFSREQSEATVHILVEVMEDELASKKDIQGLHQKLEQHAAATSHDIQSLHQKIDQQAAATTHQIQELKSSLVIKMGAMQAAAVGLVVALIKLL